MLRPYRPDKIGTNIPAEWRNVSFLRKHESRFFC